MRETDLQTGPRGLRLRLCRWGPAEGRPILVLHGFLEQGAAWHEVAQALVAALGRPVVAPDHRGHGLSEHVGRGGSYPFWDYVGDAFVLAGTLGGPVDVVGHSMGGTMAALFAATAPELVRRLVLVEGLGPPDMTGARHERARIFLEERSTPPRHPCLADLDDAVARMHRWNPEVPEATVRRLAARVTRPVLPDDPAVRDPDPAGLTWTWDPLHRGRSALPFDAAVHRAFLRRIQAPTLLVDGGTSLLRLPDAADRAAGIPDARGAVVPDAGHLVHLEQPAALAALLCTFLAPESPP